MLCTWTATYSDGSELAQYDQNNSNFIADAGEVPYRAIDWPNVVKLTFESQQAVMSFDVNPAPPGIKVSLRSRHFRTASGIDTMCFMITESAEGQEVSADSVIRVLYVFPDGSVHECENFNCPDVANYGHKLLRDEPASLMPATHTVTTEVSAVMT